MALKIRLFLTACFFTAVLVAGLAGLNSAHALDPQQVFEQELKVDKGRPSFSGLFRHYFKKKKQGKTDEALSVLKFAAEKGSQRAQWKLGQMYALGVDVKKSDSEAFHFFKRLADRYALVRPKTSEWAITGKAMVALGRYYLNGIPDADFPANKNEARVMFTTAAMYFGDSDGQYELGRMILNDSIKQPANGLQAIRLLDMSRRKGHNGAMALLGNALIEGKFISQNRVEGLTMLTKALAHAQDEEERQWIEPLQAQAFALVSEDERRQAIALLDRPASEKKLFWKKFELKKLKLQKPNFASDIFPTSKLPPLKLPAFTEE